MPVFFIEILFVLTAFS